jgi:hypothetical protein
MIPSGYHTFFGGCASVAGTLIGLLFVAITCAKARRLSPWRHSGLCLASVPLSLFSGAEPVDAGRTDQA